MKALMLITLIFIHSRPPLTTLEERKRILNGDMSIIDGYMHRFRSG